MKERKESYFVRKTRMGTLGSVLFEEATIPLVGYFLVHAQNEL